MSNTIHIVGNVTRTPELRYTTSGRGVASFGIASNRRYQKDGEWQEDVSFFDVVAWGTLGENIAASLDRGTRVVVVGRLEQRSWETNEGEKRSKVEVTADSIGADMRFARVTVEKVDRSQGGTHGGGTSAPSQSPARPSYDEEPF